MNHKIVAVMWVMKGLSIESYNHKYESIKLFQWCE